MFGEMDILRSHSHEVMPFTRMFERNNPCEFSHFFPSPIEYEGVGFFNNLHIRGINSECYYSYY